MSQFSPTPFGPGLSPTDISQVANDNFYRVGDSINNIDNTNLSTITGELGGAWKSWTPTYNNLTVGNGTVKARYTQIGKTVIARFSFVCGSTSSIGGMVRVSYPVTPNADIYIDDFPVGYGTILNSATILYPAFCMDDNSLGVNICLYGTSGNYGEASATNSAFTFGTADRISVYFIYEAA